MKFIAVKPLKMINLSLISQKYKKRRNSKESSKYLRGEIS
jgi:hypothetical protein